MTTFTTIDELIDFYNQKNNFLSAVEYTAGLTGFNPTLIEKDYLCSLVLMYLYQERDFELTFKGGTLLAKVYAGFYRLSEDLDFSFSISPEAKRKERSNKIKPYKSVVNDISNQQTINRYE